RSRGSGRRMPDLRSLRGKRTIGGLRQQHPFGRAVEIFELAALHRPEEGEQADQPHDEADRNEPDGMAHAASARCRGSSAVSGTAFSGLRLCESLRALATTMIDDADMAIAAIRGVA